MKQWYTPGGQAQRLYIDILKQPHTLIAGTTGSGKSVCMNGIIYTALYLAPSQTRFVLIDPKKTELYQYRNLPHTAAYADTPEGAETALCATIREIEQRYTRCRARGLRQSDEAAIYVFVDELSDLIYSNRATVGQLAKIARIGRAANVHLIAGTQCPNRKTLSAEFAANCPARVGLRCRDRIESRQIIGSPEATTLPAVGYCYYLSPQLLQPTLAEVPYIRDAELAARVRWWEQQKEPPKPRKWWQR